MGLDWLNHQRAIAQPTQPLLWPSHRSEMSPTTTSDIILRVDSRLEPSDTVVFQDGTPFDEHIFDGAAGQRISITLESSEFDPYLIVLAPNGDIVAQNDDRADGDLDSFVSLTIETDGPYSVIVNTVDQYGRGRYVLTIRQIEPLESPSPQRIQTPSL
jgi:hypothetical protein